MPISSIYFFSPVYQSTRRRMEIGSRTHGPLFNKNTNVPILLVQCLRKMGSTHKHKKSIKEIISHKQRYRQMTDYTKQEKKQANIRPLSGGTDRGRIKSWTILVYPLLWIVIVLRGTA